MRWADDIDDAVRLEREQRYALTKPARTDDVHTWSYELANNTPENIRALVGDPLIVDTNGVDRNASRIPTESWRERTTRRLLSFRRTTLTQDNALAWLYYATLLLPVVGALLLLIGWRSSQIPRDEVALVGSLVLLCAVIEVTLVRGSPGSRAPRCCGADGGAGRVGNGPVADAWCRRGTGVEIDWTIRRCCDRVAYHGLELRESR